MTDLHEAFLKAKAEEEEKEHEAQRCLVCINFICTCEPGARELTKTACL